jgi:leader peptidase (prepilin peptidase)/N-methyltransferase
MVAAHHVVLILLATVLGGCLGSFLNVCIYRIPRSIGLAWPPSRCPSCASNILTRDNIPVLSWILLGGRCRYCRVPISWKYPLVEAIVGLAFALDYAIRVLCPCGDVWDRSGAYNVMLRLVADEFLICSFAVTLGLLLTHDRVWRPSCSSGDRLRCVRVGREQQSLPGSQLAGRPE